MKGIAAITTPAPPTTDVVAVRNRRRPLSITASFAIQHLNTCAIVPDRKEPSGLPGRTLQKQQFSGCVM
jgi:hypothetical protein